VSGVLLGWAFYFGCRGTIRCCSCSVHYSTQAGADLPYEPYLSMLVFSIQERRQMRVLPTEYAWSHSLNSQVGFGYLDRCGWVASWLLEYAGHFFVAERLKSSYLAERIKTSETSAWAVASKTTRWLVHLDLMRKWYLPLTVLGVGGLGAFCLSQRGRSTIRWVYQNVHRAPETFLEWNDSAQRELDRIQTALNRLAETLATTR
jgi:hypothetical protein